MFALKKKKLKSLLGFFALIAAVAVVSVGVTWALVEMFGSHRNTNVFTIGNVAIELHDLYPTEQDEVDQYSAVQTIDPGSTNNYKKVYVDNIGTVPCYVRLLVKVVWERKNPTTEAYEAIPDTDPDYNELRTEFIELGYSYTDWKKHKDTIDGYDVYYYQSVLAPKDNAVFMESFSFLDKCVIEYPGYFDPVTHTPVPPYFDEVSFNKTKYSNDNYRCAIKVKAQAVQSSHVKNGDNSNNWRDMDDHELTLAFE